MAVKYKPVPYAKIPKSNMLIELTCTAAFNQEDIKLRGFVFGHTSEKEKLCSLLCDLKLSWVSESVGVAVPDRD